MSNKTTSHKVFMDYISTTTKLVLFEFGCGTSLEKKTLDVSNFVVSAVRQINPG